ncbi:piggyBac transposable element-derived protein 4-like [Palaemon carinicauda]|uniref:piggyBac transposable element-derived protein 4-like n=1 Tax=Palaemon carinicauda TaxID=392227 RepID=UPI0035B6199D
MYARGVLAKGQSVEKLWSIKWGPPFFRETMSRQRFKEIMKFLRFDIQSSRSIRMQTDKFAMISEVWDLFIKNSISCYRPSENTTVDEQLFPAKCRCSFTQYMTSKLDKFGIKFWLAANAKSKYLLNEFHYLGKDESSNKPTTLRIRRNQAHRII